MTTPNPPPSSDPWADARAAALHIPHYHHPQFRAAVHRWTRAVLKALRRELRKERQL